MTVKKHDVEFFSGNIGFRLLSKKTVALEKCLSICMLLPLCGPNDSANSSRPILFKLKNLKTVFYLNQKIYANMFF